MIVVLVSHAYHLEEIEHIGYCQLHEMVHEAHEAMTRKKATSADAIARSMRGWPPSDFAPEDSAMELRFLLGFALKTLDDPFYHVPEKEAAADRYFEARAERFRKWSQQAVPLLQRCLVIDGREVQIDFLYQDLFHGALQQGKSELWMLAMMAEFGAALEGQDPARAVITLVETDDDAALGVQLFGAAGELAHADRRLDVGDDVEAEIDDLRDALATLGIGDISVELTAP